MSDLISVIVPIYNVEKYLDKCVSSIINQTYKNLEIILVDDGATDSCSSKCDDWKLKDSRIVIIHKVNGGLSDARNSGLDIAKGQYYFFVDSDDWIRKDTIEILYKLIIENNAEIACCGVELQDEEGKILSCWSETSCPNLMDSNQAMEQYLTKMSVGAMAWNKLYSSNLFSSIRYPIGKLHEDEFTTWKVIFLANRIVYTPECLYYYIQRQGSIVNSNISLKRLDALDAMDELWLFLNEENKIELIDLFIARYCSNSLRLYRDFVIFLEGQLNSGNDEIIRKITEKKNDIFSSHNLKFIDKIKLLLIIYIPKLYNNMVWFKHK